MKRKTKLFATLALSALSILSLGAACGETAAGGSGPIGEAYEFLFDKPYAPTPDEHISVDGYLEDEIWGNKNWLEQTVNGVTWAATTHFTPKGLYIAVEATDNNMYFKTRYTSRSAFNVYVAKAGTEAININSLLYYKTEVQQFILDPYYCRSKDRVPYYYEAQVKGELNSETECTMTGELFLAWSDLYYTQEELGEKGYPETIQMYVNYNGEGKEVLGSCLWRQETYFHYDTEGLIGAIDHQDFGNAIGGLAATDQWEINEKGNLQTTAGRTQIAWLKNANAKNYMFEAELKPLGTRVNDQGQTESISIRGDRVVGRFGLITARNPWADSVTTVSGYSIYSADARSICDQKAGNKKISLMTYRQTDSFHWCNLVGMSQTVKTNHTDETVTLRIIKEGDNFHYFYGDEYWASERNSNLQEEVFTGVFTSQGVEIVDYKFIDYDNNVEEIQTELKKYMYFIEVAGEMTRGSVTVDKYAVGKGQPATITFQAKAKNILTNITRGTNAQNAESVFEEILPLLNEKNEYTFTPTGDVYFGGEYTAFPKDSIVRTLIEFKDETGAKVMDGTYEVYSASDKRMYYKGTPNAAGYLLLDMPKKGTYQVGNETIEVSGEYTVNVKFTRHHAYSATFTIDENTPLDEKGQYRITETIASNAWGQVTVNGKEVSTAGKLLYNEETGNYYTDGSVRTYYKQTVATNYVANVKMHLDNVGNRNADLMGLAITDGTDLVLLKYNLENRGKLIICSNNQPMESIPGVEYAITGFDYDRVQEPYGVGNNGYGTVSITVVKCGSAIYVYNSAGVMKFYLNKEGVNLVNGATFSWGASDSNKATINDDVKALFSNGENTQTALGLFTYPAAQLRAEMDLDFTTDISAYKESIGYGEMRVQLPASQTLDTEHYPVREAYAMGETVRLGVKVANAKYAKMQLVIHDKFGTHMVDGVYDWSTGAITFEFIYAGGATHLSTVLSKDGDMSWSNEWGEFIPDRENTMPEYTEGGETVSNRLYLALPQGQTLDHANYPVKTSYETGETVKIGVKMQKPSDMKVKLLITDQSGTYKIDGVYDSASDCYVFEFTFAGGDAYATTVFVPFGSMEWSSEWGEFIPNRENTMP